MIDNKSIQRALVEYKHFFGAIDGLLGAKTNKAIELTLVDRLKGPAVAKWPVKRQLIAFQQLMMTNAGIDAGAIDGLWGPQTQMALEKWQDRLRDVPAPVDPALPGSFKVKWPTQGEVPAYYGTRGANQQLYTPPYPFLLYDTKQEVPRISVHRKVVGSLDKVLQAVLTAYGLEKIHELHLDRYFGSLNVRKMKGGSGWSMHSWGIAIDFDANRNQLRWGRDQAAFAKPAYDKWNQAWETEGWVSLGRERNYDWMHYQAARL